MKKLLSSVGVMAVAMFGYASLARADYPIPLNISLANNGKFLVSVNEGTLLASAYNCIQQSKNLSCTLNIAPLYRDNSTVHLVNLVPRNDVHSNCFKSGSVWQIDVYDSRKKISSFTYRYTAGVPAEWGTMLTIPSAAVATSPVSTVSNMVELEVVIVPKSGTRSPLPTTCVRSLSWNMVMAEWTREWLSSYTVHDFIIGYKR